MPTDPASYLPAVQNLRADNDRPVEKPAPQNRQQENDTAEISNEGRARFAAEAQQEATPQPPEQNRAAGQIVDTVA